MKAIVRDRYGSHDVLRCADIETPTPGDDEVLIKVCAASVNPMDWHDMRGMPYLMRLGSGLTRPKRTRLGVDVAGEVEAVGSSVAHFRPGDVVFGAARGAFAEYVCARESAVATKPDNVTFEQAAAAPVAGFTALQGLRDRGRIQQGQKVLINGAAGGVGTFAVQVAKWFGAEVTGVCSTRNVSMVRSIGADQVIDYSQVNFTEQNQRYDIFFDCIGNHPLSACRRLLGDEGRYVLVGGHAGRWVDPLPRAVAALMLSALGSRKLLVFLARGNREDLLIIGELMKTGKVTPVIDRRYPLSDAPDALRYLGEGHARGKVTITVSQTL